MFIDEASAARRTLRGSKPAKPSASARFEPRPEPSRPVLMHSRPYHCAARSWLHDDRIEMLRSPIFSSNTRVSATSRLCQYPKTSISTNGMLGRLYLVRTSHTCTNGFRFFSTAHLHIKTDVEHIRRNDAMRMSCIRLLNVSEKPHAIPQFRIEAVGCCWLSVR